MWSCPQVARFWNEVLNTVGHIIGRVMPTDPKLCILNIYPANFVITNDKKSLIDMCLLEAKRCIARSWKKTTVCSVLEWLNGVTFYMALEKISYFTKNKIDRDLNVIVAVIPLVFFFVVFFWGGGCFFCFFSINIFHILYLFITV